MPSEAIGIVVHTMDHDAAKEMVNEQVNGWLDLFDDDMKPKPGTTIPANVLALLAKFEQDKMHAEPTPTNMADGMLALPAPGDSGAASTTDEGGTQTIIVGGAPVKLDKLGPVVVNTDGTISRIANWHDMTEAEQQKTMRVVGKRNTSRMAALQAKRYTQQTVVGRQLVGAWVGYG
jgi:hypothetical protein